MLLKLSNIKDRIQAAWIALFGKKFMVFHYQDTTANDGTAELRYTLIHTGLTQKEMIAYTDAVIQHLADQHEADEAVNICNDIITLAASKPPPYNYHDEDDGA